MSEFTLEYVPQRAIKGQVLADFVADHPGITLREETISCCDIAIWEMWFDGSMTSQGAGARVHIISPLGASYRLSFRLQFESEYEALIFGLEILAELGAKAINVRGDSLLVIKQVIREFKCESELLVRYCNKWVQDKSTIRRNRKRNAESPYWGITINERRLRSFALNYVVLAGKLYKKGFEGLLFRCIGPKEAMLAMAEVHEGIAGAHQAGPRMRWLIHKYGFYWPKMEQDCIRYAKGGWAVDLIWKIYLGSSDGHTFVIIATCYFTKWVEAKPLKSPTQEAVIKFFKEYIVHRHGLPESITTDQGKMFTRADIDWWASQMKIKMLHSTSYYAQANGQAEAANKSIKLIVQKMAVENPRQWHVLLSETV
ncbi:uncharacterized protein LOC126667635 [Mercurialis annua]|uniref:uncharacterized protein LOC126667635 n=1 Tax=Mercurialis annua TaxID=3986 RepID=UPI00215F8534|nr:uncharacterized protein LOC126667635 [Mercurialis annua]